MKLNEKSNKGIRLPISMVLAFPALDLAPDVPAQSSTDLWSYTSAPKETDICSPMGVGLGKGLSTTCFRQQQLAHKSWSVFITSTLTLFGCLAPADSVWPGPLNKKIQIGQKLM